MRAPSALLSLPPSLLLLLAAQLHAQQVDSGGGEQDGQLQPSLPSAVRKMSPDEGEKFMPHYYAFATVDLHGGRGGSDPQSLLARWIEDGPVLTPEEEALLAANSSAALVFRPPFPRHHNEDPARTRSGGREAGKGLYRRTVDVLARLRGRAFTCPAGTHDCSSIDEPNYCCTDGTSCFVVEDAPDAGNVGCCPDGQTCGGSVAACADGNTACPAEEGGGCCIPGFVCADVGCVQSATATPSSTTTTAKPTPTSTSTTSTSTPTTTTTTTTTTSSTTTAAQTTTMTSASDSDSSPSDTGTGLPPVRPTSYELTSTETPPPSDYCPTGFYGCLATAGSGCCRTGRDCSTTSCPPIASTTIITDGATVVVPLTNAGPAPTKATCADGWFLCGAGAGDVAGCCPTGYMCGTASCTLSAATATATVQKELPGNGAAGGRRALRSALLTCVCVVALGWVV
ncbi:hypothetical protein F4808DRAFT_408305 [Astrocystis sublimbata]|nr:hypothetical protein F4808DRAFT_408305 [Astrocystis sublimbata]